jgi:carbonic anhydrase/acetyltransferase-like protein (isoleucine patch superfamily)
MPTYRIDDLQPVIDPSAYIAPTAVIIGKVRIGQLSSVWFNCVLRGDADAIIVGDESNIQDLTMCHADPGKPLRVGNQVTIGHRCIIHGCTIEDNCLIGMGAVIMNGAVIGRNSIVAAGAVVLENTIVPPCSLMTGVPARVKNTLEEKAREFIDMPRRIYVERSKLYGSPERFEALD